MLDKIFNTISQPIISSILSFINSICCTFYMNQSIRKDTKVQEGLKENTRFKNPKAHQRLIMLNTLEKAYNLEEVPYRNIQRSFEEVRILKRD